jgi:hypothetical protein
MASCKRLAHLGLTTGHWEKGAIDSPGHCGCKPCSGCTMNCFEECIEESQGGYAHELAERWSS